MQALAREAGTEDGSLLEMDADNRLSAALKQGMSEIATGLAQVEPEWREHGLGPVHAVRAAAADATARFGKEAGEKLREQADALFAAASSKGLLVGSTSSPLPSEVLPAENVHRPEPQGDDVREKMEQAVVKWRAALWVMLDPDSEGHSSDACHSAWEIVDTRHRFWTQVRPTNTRQSRMLHR